MPIPFDTLTIRQAAYRARLALRSNAGPIAYLRGHKLTADEPYGRLVRTFVDVLPALLMKHCIAEAEAKAIDIINKEWN